LAYCGNTLDYAKLLRFITNVISVRNQAMRLASTILCSFLIIGSPTYTFAANEGWFASINGGTEFRFGSTSVKNAGAHYTGIMHKVKFDPSYVVEGIVGYESSSPLSTYLSISLSEGDINWLTNFSGTDSEFTGSARSVTLLANLGYNHAISERLTLQTTLGAGFAINQLSTVEESLIGGATYAYVDGNTTNGLAARAGLNLIYNIDDTLSLTLSTNANYTGAFQSGKTRNFSGVQEAIGRYKIDDSWNTTFSGGIRWKF
jgi:hypothetical protein